MGARPGRWAAGASFGGAAASYIAQAYPHAFGNVLSLSGSFWVKGQDDDSDDEWAWLPRRFERAPRLPLCFYLCIGLFERGNRLFGRAPEQLSINHRMRDVLQARGYAPSYREYNGGGWR